MKKCVIIGGGTNYYISNHLALSAPAYGSTARHLAKLCKEHSNKLLVDLRLTKMAGGENLDTVYDVRELVEDIISDYSVKIVFFNVAMVDFKSNGLIDDEDKLYSIGKYEQRLESSKEYKLYMTAQEKVINLIRKNRKDIFLVGFKTTCGADEQTMYLKGLNLLKKASCNLVLVNDVKDHINMIVTPEEAAYHVHESREQTLRNLVEMAYLRSHLTFTRSTVISGDSIPWKSSLVPQSLRTVVNHCIDLGAYKPFRGSTVGHFAVKVDDTTFLTSKRKTNFNDLNKIGLVKVVTDGPDSVVAYGSKPSVGGQSQRIIFQEHAGMDCIVHFHCPLRDPSAGIIPVMSQREFECGSHECGKNTSNGLKKFGNLYAVHLEKHGPNIVFNRDIDPEEVIDFIREHWDLSGKTGGYLVWDL